MTCAQLLQVSFSAFVDTVASLWAVPLTAGCFPLRWNLGCFQQPIVLGRKHALRLQEKARVLLSWVHLVRELLFHSCADLNFDVLLHRSILIWVQVSRVGWWLAFLLKLGDWIRRTANWYGALIGSATETETPSSREEGRFVFLFYLFLIRSLLLLNVCFHVFNLIIIK